MIRKIRSKLSKVRPKLPKIKIPKVKRRKARRRRK
jgi:hypothetical protein